VSIEGKEEAVSQLTGLMGRIFALAAAAGTGGGVFIESDGGNSTTIFQSGPFGGDAKVEVSRGDGFIVIQRRDDQGNSVTVIQGAGRGKVRD
jgi:hypothetical protein